MHYKPASVAGRFAPAENYEAGVATTPQVLAVHHPALMPYTELSVFGSAELGPGKLPKYANGICELSSYAILTFRGSIELTLPTTEQGASTNWQWIGDVVCWATYQGPIELLEFPVILRTPTGFKVTVNQPRPVEVRIYVTGRAGL